MHVDGVKRHSKYAVRAHDIFAHNFLKVFHQMLKGLKVKITFDPFGIHSKMADITEHAFEIKFPFSINKKVSIYILSSHKLC